MRTSVTVVISVLTASALAAADPAAIAPDDLRNASSTFLLALGGGERSALEAMFAPVVTVDGMEFDDRVCNKAFGRSKQHTVAKKHQRRLASCLLVAWQAGADIVTIGDRTIRLVFRDKQYDGLGGFYGDHSGLSGSGSSGPWATSDVRPQIELAFAIGRDGTPKIDGIQWPYEKSNLSDIMRLGKRRGD